MQLDPIPNDQNNIISSKSLSPIQKIQRASSKNWALKILNEELKVNHTLQAGKREQEKYMTFIDKINQIYNYPKKPLLMSRAAWL